MLSSLPFATFNLKWFPDGFLLMIASDSSDSEELELSDPLELYSSSGDFSSSLIGENLSFYTSILFFVFLFYFTDPALSPLFSLSFGGP